MLTQCQAFKAAFLHSCMEQGFTLDETHELVKQACSQLSGEKQATGPWPWLKDNIPGLSIANDVVGGTVGGLASAAPGLAVGAYLGIPAAAGGLAGYGIAQLEGLNDEDPSEIKTQEKIEAYRRAAARAALQRSLRAKRESHRPSRPLL
jgi:hypothetical protein